MKPIKVMIVDDEILAIRHLRNLVCWEEHGFIVAAEAVTAIQALEYSESVNPQVIFMDIRMPALDGLEVSKRILARNSRVKIILLTSYRDFEYAKAALKMGISGYLIKHETNNVNLTEELHKLKRELGVEEQQEQFVFRQHLKGVLEGSELPDHVLGNWERSARESGKRFVFFYLQVDAPFPILEVNIHLLSASLPNAKEWQEGYECCEFRALDWIESVSIGKGKQLILFSAATYSSEGQLLNDAYSTASFLQSEAGKRGISLSILISPAFKNMAALTELYRQVDMKSLAFVLHGKQKILNSQDVNLPESELEEQWRIKIQRLRSLPDQPEEQELIYCLQDIFAEIKPERFHPDSLKLICKEFIRILEHQMENKGMRSYGEMIKNDEVVSSRWHSVEDIKQWFLEEISRIQRFAPMNPAYSRKIQLAVRYIHEHYTEELTVEAIGESLSLSGDHLRHLFKEEVGRTVSDYLTGYRMDKAKELFKINKFKIYEISEKVGYKTSQYFSQVFKKWTGVTPQEFTERVAKRNEKGN